MKSWGRHCLVSFKQLLAVYRTIALNFRNTKNHRSLLQLKIYANNVGH